MRRVGFDESLVKPARGSAFQWTGRGAHVHDASPRDRSLPSLWDAFAAVTTTVYRIVDETRVSVVTAVAAARRPFVRGKRSGCA